MATIYSIILFHFVTINLTVLSNSESILSPDVLVGIWKLDMTPTVSTDSNFAYMKIDSVEENSFYHSCIFYSK